MIDVDNYMDLDTAIDKFKIILENGNPSPTQLKKYQKILDGIADAYADFHDKDQLSELYLIQAEIYELSGKPDLAKDARFRAKDVKKNHKRARNILIFFTITGVIAIIAIIFFALTQKQNEAEARRADCIKAAKSSAESNATLEADKSDYKPATPEYKSFWQSIYDENYKKSSAECYNI